MPRRLNARLIEDRMFLSPGLESAGLQILKFRMIQDKGSAQVFSSSADVHLRPRPWRPSRTTNECSSCHPDAICCVRGPGGAHPHPRWRILMMHTEFGAMCLHASRESGLIADHGWSTNQAAARQTAACLQ